MKKLLTGFTAAAAVALFASAAQADCSGHDVTASSERPESVAMSTYDGPALPPAAEESEKSAQAAVPVCAEGDKDCSPATE